MYMGPPREAADFTVRVQACQMLPIRMQPPLRVQVFHATSNCKQGDAGNSRASRQQHTQTTLACAAAYTVSAEAQFSDCMYNEARLNMLTDIVCCRLNCTCPANLPIAIHQILHMHDQPQQCDLQEDIAWTIAAVVPLFAL